VVFLVAGLVAGSTLGAQAGWVVSPAVRWAARRRAAALLVQWRVASRPGLVLGFPLQEGWV
jgi:hypothetical protein